LSQIKRLRTHRWCEASLHARVTWVTDKLSHRVNNPTMLPRKYAMSRMLATALLALASGTSFGQMMGGSMSTVQYFPLVDGARYDYMFVSGPRTAATATRLPMTIS
jgi:hypothetical protein